MHFFAICPLVEEHQAPVAEMLLTRIPGAYYHNGGGFCIDAAAQSTACTHFSGLTPIEQEACWNDSAHWVEHNTPGPENYKKQRAAFEREQARRAAAKKAHKEGVEKYILDVAKVHFDCQAWKDHATWQTLERQAHVKYMEEQWEETKEKYLRTSTK
jgi:hypothetical protein